MNFICDVNIAIRVSKFLVAQGAVAIHVNQLAGKWNTPDRTIRALADAKGLVVVTKDTDFRESFLLQGTPKKLLHVCLGNAATEDVIELLRTNWLILTRYATADRFYLELNYNGLFPIVA